MSKEDRLEEISDSLDGILEELENISEALGELNITLHTIGFFLIMDKMAETRPELREKLAPIAEEFLGAFDMAMEEQEE